MRIALLAAALAVVASGCVGGAGEATTTETATTQPIEQTRVRVYFLRDGKVWPALREIESGPVAAQALDELLRGPTTQERADLDLTSALPHGAALSAAIGRVAEVRSTTELSEEARAQLVYTLTQLPTVESVEIDGASYTNADFERVTPAILVESPLPFEEVSSPLRVTGTANTFEATFDYELTDTDGKIVGEGFVTATSGSGARGRFDFTSKPYTVPFDGIGSLVVFERSAKDGSRIHLVEIPLRMGR